MDMSPDALLLIFIYATDPSPQLPAVSQVCRPWRAVSLSIPSLWTHISLDLRRKTSRSKGFLSFLSTLLARSENAPLVVWIAVSDSRHPALDTLVRHSNRWRTAAMHAPVGVISTLRGVRGRLECLETLELTVGAASDATESVVYDMFQFAPSLHKVCIRSERPVVFVLPWAQLTHYDDAQGGHGDVIASLTSIKELRTTWRAPNSSNDTLMTLNDLDKLDITFFYLSHRDFFERLVLPNVKEIIIKDHAGTPVLPLTAMLSRSPSPILLQKLTFHTEFNKPGQLTSLLQLVPHLQELNICLPPIDDLTNFIYFSEQSQLVPNLQKLRFVANSVRESSAILRPLAFTRCEWEGDDLWNEYDIKPPQRTTLLSSFVIAFREPQIHCEEREYLEVPRPILDGAADKECLNLLWYWRQQILDAMPWIAEATVERKRSLTARQLRFLDRMFSSVEHFNPTNVQHLHTTRLHLTLDLLRSYRPSHIPGNKKYHFQRRADKILERWSPLLLSDIENRQWALQGHDTLVYIPLGDQDAVDQNGLARYEASGWGTINDDSTIAPWLDLPPTPPPKSATHSKFSSSSKTLGFGPKASFASLVSLGQSSSRNGQSQSTLHLPESKRRSADDGDSSRTLVYSGSSTNSGEIRKAKSSIFSKLKSRPSKAHLRNDSDDAVHPSLLPPVPPLPAERGMNNLLNTFVSPSLSAPPGKKDKKGKKKSNGHVPPTPPPKGEEEFKIDLDFEHMDGIVNMNLASTSGPSRDPSSPSSGFDSAHSYSDHSSHHQHTYSFLPPSEFSDPFSTTSLQDKRKGIMPGVDFRRVSPKTPMPPRPTASTSSGPGSPTWVAPESWAVEKGTEDPYNSTTNGDVSEVHDSDSDLSNEGALIPIGRRREDSLRPNGKSKDPASASFSSISSTMTVKRVSRPSLRGLPQQPPPGFSYKMRIHRQNNTYHVVAIGLDTTVAMFSQKLSKKLKPEEDRVQHNLYMKEQGRERILGQNECPAQIVKLRMEQAGYDFEDGLHLLGAESLGILLRFVYKSQLLAGEEQIPFDTFAFVDLSGRGLRTIPVILHQHADSIISLRLSRNPMLEIPLDFIQSCTTLRELRLTHMYMKKVPQSLRYSTTLHRLDLSSNCIKDLEEAYLDHIQGLLALIVQNNRLEKLPWHFPRLRSLVTLNISNNKFRKFPSVLISMENLRELDISFNMITELPDDIGRLKTLERFILVGNQISKFPDDCSGLVSLRMLDCRRNQISDLSSVCMLPQLNSLSADHNMVHALDLSLGAHLTTLDASHNDITQLSLVPGPMGKLPYALTSLDLSYAKLSSLDDLALSQLSSLRTLKLDHNSIRSIPESLGELKWLETLSCTDNKLDALPSNIGNLQRLEVLDAHNNSLTELPQSLWNCASLMKINVTSNFLGGWHDPPVMSMQESPVVETDLAFIDMGRKTSTASITSTRNLPPLVHSLDKLYLGENCFTDNVIHPLMIFKELKVLNLSFNEIQDLPPNFFRNMTQLEELYLSGNKLTSIPVEDFPRLTKLTTLYLNGNKLHTLPQELGKVYNLTILDVGSNVLKYNINNWEFDWNWNFNTNLKYLNLSGNKRLVIKAEGKRPHEVASSRMSRYLDGPELSTPMLSGFTNLTQLKVLGLMDVTITTTAKDASVDIPDENADRRVRTSSSSICGMGYGIADSLGKDDHLTMLDLVYEPPLQKSEGEVVFAMFGRTHPSKHIKPGSSPNKLAKYIHSSFMRVFMTQLGAVYDKQAREGVPEELRREGIPKALHWTFLKLNQDLRESLHHAPRKNSQASTTTQQGADAQYTRTGVSGIALYFFEKTIFAANVGDALAVVSRQGVCHEISRKHDPYDRLETARIRAAEGFVSPPGLVNDDVDVSRAFGYYQHFPPINARPDIFVYDLTDMDEFVIVANSGLWDFVPFQTAVDIARTVMRTERPDPMLAAQKLRDFAISYGSEGTTMIMVIWVADRVNASRSRQPTLDSIVDPQAYRARRKDEVRDKIINRLNGEVPPPIGHVTLAFTDIRNSTHLWEVNPGMPTAMRLHNHLLRRQLRFCGGYEVKTEGDAFMCSFPTALAAVWWCLSVQVELLQEQWPLEILECEDGKPIYDEDGRLIARGLSVRMGIHSGMPVCETDVITRRMDYFGPMVNRSARINGCAQGGQIMCSNDIIREINAKVKEIEEETEYSKLQSPQAVEAIRRLDPVIIPIGEVKLKGIELPEVLSAIYPAGLQGRHELKDVPSDTTASGSRVQFSSAQMRELGVLCLRIEALSSGRIFKALPDRKGSIQSNPEFEEREDSSSIFYGDPNILLPPVTDLSTDSDLMSVLDSLILRIENAIASIAQRYQLPSSKSSENPSESLLDALNEDGVLDEETIEYIASILRRR
ncbi:unnamed protein product [Cyclocybe aegerita]|uniref:Adenylate cyclase n=1 Tax=Cyclocybe aegerita TaxID=1973307 RepID=A0A8S0WM97_CYCAE|nr:unnamed protein product [Cyclocybe aegerita]